MNCYSAFGTSNIVICPKEGNPQLKKMDDVQVTNGDILDILRVEILEMRQFCPQDFGCICFWCFALAYSFEESHQHLEVPQT